MRRMSEIKFWIFYETLPESEFASNASSSSRVVTYSMFDLNWSVSRITLSECKAMYKEFFRLPFFKKD